MSTVSGKAYVRENGPKDWSAIPRGDSYLFLYWCPEKWLDLTTSHDRVQKLPFFCLSLVKFNQVHIACSSYRNQTLLLKIILKNFDLPLYEWRFLSTDIFVDFFALDFIFIP